MQNGKEDGIPYLRLMRMTTGTGDWPELASI